MTAHVRSYLRLT